ncbi:hypothetical protein HGRIS_014055 [Hohenbuehelia grisea]|uniref:Uncharacterized protein n=1 Tax=Hohenbuehelia grisea TaxID=104357 RepID=A0ABR3JTM0_9AGAR
MRTLIDNFVSGYLGEPIQEWSDKYGNIMNIRILFVNGFFTTEPEHVKIVLASQFDSFEKGPVFFQMMNSLLGTGVFNSDGERIGRIGSSMP